MEQMHDSGLGVPPPHPFAPQGYAREQAGSGFPLYSSAGLPACGVPLQSVTRITRKCLPADRGQLVTYRYRLMQLVTICNRLGQLSHSKPTTP